MMLRADRCAECPSRCAGTPIRCQLGAAKWLIDTVVSFGGTLATGHAVAGLWLADQRVSPAEEVVEC